MWAQTAATPTGKLEYFGHWLDNLGSQLCWDKVLNYKYCKDYFKIIVSLGFRYLKCLVSLNSYNNFFQRGKSWIKKLYNFLMWIWDWIVELIKLKGCHRPSRICEKEWSDFAGVDAGSAAYRPRKPRLFSRTSDLYCVIII